MQDEESESESEQLVIEDLPTNIIAVIFKYLPEKDMFMAAFTCKKFYSALSKDFLMEELSRRNIMFLPDDEGRSDSWKEIFEFLHKYKASEKSGSPRKYRSIPYRGHALPIEAFCGLENQYNFDSTLVSGDGEGNLFTWNLEEDEDDPDEKIMTKDLIFKADEGIKGIKKFNEDNNIIVWTAKNKFYIYNVDLTKNTKYNKNSKRFALKCEFNIDSDDTIEEIFYDEDSEKIFLSPDFRKRYNNIIAYSYNIKKQNLEVYNFGYDNIQSNFIQKDESVKASEHPMDIDNSLNVAFNEIPLIDNNHVNCFVVCGSKLVFYINYEPVKKQLIKKYNCKKLLPNVFFIDNEKKTTKDIHIDLDYILNIIKISDDNVAFIGINENNYLSIKIYSTDNQVLLGEKILSTSNINNISKFNMLYSDAPEFYYLINNRQLYKMNLSNFKQINIKEISKSMKEISNVNWVESDRHRIVMASDNLYIAIFDITNGEFWYNFLGGSLTVFPKSYVKHPFYEGFHILQITRNSIISAMGNLIREYKFVFKK